MPVCFRRRDNNGIAGSQFYQQGWIEMLWIVLLATLVAVALLLLLCRKFRKKIETEIAF
jgi:lipoprotein signal peptidase